MVDEVKATVDWERLKEAMDKAPGELFTKVRARWAKLHRQFIRRIKTRGFSGRPHLKSRSGFFRRHIDTETTGHDLNSLKSQSFAAGVPYAEAQERGGTIHAVRAKYLTIPLPAALTPAGVLRKRARLWENTFFKKSKAGNLILFQKQSGKIIPLFLLKKSVTLKGRLGWFATWKRTEPKTMRKLAMSVDEVLDE